MDDELTLEQWPLDRFIPYARNPRKNDTAIDRMAAAIREFGFRVPVLAQSDGTVVDGHLRLKAAHKLGIDTIPVILSDGMTPAQVKAFRLLANRSVTWAEWDTELLSLELNELKDLDFDLDLTGFDADELGQYIYPETGFIPDSSTKEINPDEYKMEHRCPRCGFEFNDNEQSV